MALTPKQEAAEPRYYVYNLIDPRNGEVFYVGKGCGNRIKNHSSNARCGVVTNVEKHRRIQAIHDAGLQVIEQIVSRHEAEAEALKIERAMIGAMRKVLTNIAGGNRTNAEICQERAKEALKRIKPFDLWMQTIHPRQKAAVGDMRAFYDDHVAFFKRMAGLAQA